MDYSTFLYCLDVCNDNVISGSNGLPDSAMTVSSEYGINDKLTNYGSERARLNSTETKDAAGVIQMGAWVAEKGNMMQWIQVTHICLYLIKYLQIYRLLLR